MSVGGRRCHSFIARAEFSICVKREITSYRDSSQKQLRFTHRPGEGGDEDRAQLAAIYNLPMPPPPRNEWEGKKPPKKMIIKCHPYSAFSSLE